MRRLLPFVALMMGIMLIPPLASANDMFYVNSATIITTATIPATTAVPDANFGAMGTGFGQTMLTANNDIGVNMPAGTTYDVPTHFCLRAKGSGHSAGVLLDSASALTSESIYSLIVMTGTYYDVATTTATPAGATGTCTWHPLRC
ncbi:MAG: hypothetical protein WCT33_04480 [Patescibacteria group bacterium]